MVFDLAIQKHSPVVVVHPKPDVYIADLRCVCEFVKKNVHIHVSVKLLNDNAFYWIFLRIARLFLSMRLFATFEESITNGKTEVIWQIPEQYGSVKCVVTKDGQA
jgi:hypothetical protein